MVTWFVSSELLLLLLLLKWEYAWHQRISMKHYVIHSIMKVWIFLELCRHANWRGVSYQSFMRGGGREELLFPQFIMYSWKTVNCMCMCMLLFQVCMMWLSIMQHAYEKSKQEVYPIYSSQWKILVLFNSCGWDPKWSGDWLLNK